MYRTKSYMKSAYNIVSASPYSKHPLDLSGFLNAATEGTEWSAGTAAWNVLLYFYAASCSADALSYPAAVGYLSAQSSCSPPVMQAEVLAASAQQAACLLLQPTS